MSNDSWAEMEAEIERTVEAALTALRGRGRTLYVQAIDADDTSNGRPELWCIVMADTNELVEHHMSDADVERFLSSHPDWVHVYRVHEIEDRIHEAPRPDTAAVASSVVERICSEQ